MTATFELVLRLFGEAFRPAKSLLAARTNLVFRGRVWIAGRGDPVLATQATYQFAVEADSETT